MQRCEFSAVLYSLLRSGLLASLLLAGCASSPKVSVEDQVGNRALQWADALMAGDFDKALTFMTPTYQNSPRSGRFEGDFAGASYWRDAAIKWVKCDGESSFPSSRIDTTGAVNEVSSGNAKSIPADDNADDCVVNAWEDCGKDFNTPFSKDSTVSVSSDRCEVRLILTVMKPPEMTYPMPIPYEMTWLNLDGRWHMTYQ